MATASCLGVSVSVPGVAPVGTDYVHVLGGVAVPQNPLITKNTQRSIFRKSELLFPDRQASDAITNTHNCFPLDTEASSKLLAPATTLSSLKIYNSSSHNCRRGAKISPQRHLTASFHPTNCVETLQCELTDFTHTPYKTCTPLPRSFRAHVLLFPSLPCHLLLLVFIFIVSLNAKTLLFFATTVGSNYLHCLK